MYNSARQITASADRMARIIADLVDVAQRRSRGGISITPVRADVSAICRRAVEELEASYPGRTIGLSAEGDLSGDLDADRLEQAILNLLTSFSPAKVAIVGESSGRQAPKTSASRPEMPSPPVASLKAHLLCLGLMAQYGTVIIRTIRKIEMSRIRGSCSMCEQAIGVMS